MSQCQQAHTLLSQIKALQGQLHQEWRIPTLPTASLGTSANSDFAKASSDRREWSKKRNELYTEIQIAKSEIRKAIEQLEQILWCSTVEEAERILGKENILGPEAVENLFEVKIHPEKIPPIPFTKKELNEARIRREMLILRVAQTKAGLPLTMVEMLSIIQQKLGSDKINFHDTIISFGKFQGERFLIEDAPVEDESSSLEWALVSSNLLFNSRYQNYLRQANQVYLYLKAWLSNPTKNKFPEGKIKLYKQAVVEFEDFCRKHFGGHEEENIGNILFIFNDEDNKKFNKMISSLKINQLFLYKPVQFLYDLMLLLHHRSVMHMKGFYTQTKTLNSNDKIVHIGTTEDNAVNIYLGNVGYKLEKVGIAMSHVI